MSFNSEGRRICRDEPEEHARFGRVPLCQSREMSAHGALEDVALLAVDLGHRLGMGLEPVVAPGIEDGVGDGLRQRGRLQAGYSSLCV